MDKKKLCIAILLLVWLYPAKITEPHLFFKKIQDYNLKRFPNFFKVEVVSSVIDLQKKTFPSEMIEFNQEPKLYLLFKKNHSPILILEGVLEYYVNYFAPYETIIQNTGVFLGIDNFNSYRKFSKEYAIKIRQPKSGGYLLSVREREGLEGDYAKYHFNDEFKIFKIVFYRENKVHGTSKIFFQTFGDHTLPKRIIVNFEEPEIGGLKEFFIDFSEYRIDPKLGEKFFLEE